MVLPSALRTAAALGGWVVAICLLASPPSPAVDRTRFCATTSASLPPQSSPPPPLPLALSHRKWPAPIRTFKYKGELPSLLAEERLRFGVEVGVFKGGFSRWMLDHWRTCEKYYMVDLWDAQLNYRQMDSTSRAENLQRMEVARKNVQPYIDTGKAVLVRNSSVHAAQLFADGALDFVYLDARHTYDAVNEDLSAWWPKIRAGGILAGEDYMDSDEVWTMTASCDFGPKQDVYPWSGCDKWRLPRGAFFECNARPECARVKLGSPEAAELERAGKPCGSDYTLQADGTRRKDNKAVRAAVDEFANLHERQVQLAYRDNQRAFMWNTWAIRR